MVTRRRGRPTAAFAKSWRLPYGKPIAHVMFRIGDILESGADLTVLPCSTQGHISTTAEARVQRFQLPLPSLLSLGDIEAKRFPGRVSRIIVWAASVNDRRSNPDAIRSIGERLGSFANDNRWIQIMESPLLGTGGIADDLRGVTSGLIAVHRADNLGARRHFIIAASMKIE
jgi:hypothetical protein